MMIYECHTIPQIVDKIIGLKESHNLPIEVLLHIEKDEEGLQIVSLNFADKDEMVAQWLTETAINETLKDLETIENAVHDTPRDNRPNP